MDARQHNLSSQMISSKATLPSAFILALIFLAPPRPASADVKLPAIISDHMVLQKAGKVPIWGKADPGEEVTVTIDGKTAKATGVAPTDTIPPDEADRLTPQDHHHLVGNILLQFSRNLIHNNLQK